MYINREFEKRKVRQEYLKNPIRINDGDTMLKYKEYIFAIRRKTGLGPMDIWHYLKEIVSENETD